MPTPRGRRPPWAHVLLVWPSHGLVVLTQAAVQELMGEVVPRDDAHDLGWEGAPESTQGETSSETPD